MDRKEIILAEMKHRMELRVEEYVKEGIWDERLDSEREGREKNDIDRGFRVYDLYLERIQKRSWYPTADLIEGSDFYEYVDELFTCTWYFYVQFEATFIMNLSEEGYEELVDNDESYWADAVIEQLEENYDMEKLVDIIVADVL